ncbi:hypothetical protein CC78DRAFT_576507 [Lojkania enalia]|uniref:Uncharacterized protein n=1 Tax=Lojkania enalia TaxID=147567 RepID=A0A9P4KF17_9PLEO|nr:hypothetical protein CC78DRAFT_576507 [Didymosphaeria enalia]
MSHSTGTMMVSDFTISRDTQSITQFFIPPTTPSKSTLEPSQDSNSRQSRGPSEEMELLLTRKLNLVGRIKFLPLYNDLKHSRPRTPQLRFAADSVRSGLISKIQLAIKRAGRCLGFDIVDRGKQDLEVRRRDMGPGCKTHSHSVAHIYIELWGGAGRHPKDYSRSGVPPTVSLIDSKGRQMFILKSPDNIWMLFLAVLDCEVEFVTRQLAATGNLVPKVSREEMLSSFRDNMHGKDPFLDEALFNLERNDLYGTVLNLTKALALRPSVCDCGAMDSDHVKIGLEHVFHWNAAIAASHKTRQLSLSLDCQEYNIEVSTGQEGRHIIYKFFQDILKAYNEEVNNESKRLSKSIREWNGNKASRPPAKQIPTPEEVRQQTKESLGKRKAVKHALRVAATKKRARQSGEPPSNETNPPPGKQNRSEPPPSLISPITFPDKLEEEEDEDEEERMAEEKRDSTLKRVRETLSAETDRELTPNEIHTRAIQEVLTQMRADVKQKMERNIRPIRRKK